MSVKGSRQTVSMRAGAPASRRALRWRLPRVLLAFTLTFSLVAGGGLLNALALAWAQSGASTPFVGNICVYQQVNGILKDDILANAVIGYSGTVDIEESAGTLQLVSLLTWRNGTGDEDESGADRVSWQSTDTKVASVSPTGLVTAAGDGSCDIECSIAADQGITDGVDLKATVHLNVSGQSDAVRVTAIEIWCDGEVVDNTGNPIIKTVEESQLATEVLALYAVVDVLDPKTNETKTYSTKDGLISKQVPGLADIVWSVENSDYADIDAVNGSYRQNNFGASVVYATWGEGTDYMKRTQATITYRDANPSENQDGFSPQTTLRIKAYYEVSTTGEKFDKPPADDAGQFVVDKTLSLSQVKGIDSTTATYSSVDSTTGSYMTITGTGAYLSKLIEEAGVEIDGIAGFWFQTADSGGGVYAEGVSYDFLYPDSGRYYYPHAKDNGEERYRAEVQVWPIVAWETSQLHRNDGNCQPDYDMNNGRSFCLLMGGTKDGGNSNKWARNIKTIYIKLSGKAPAGDEDGDDKDKDKDKKDDGDGDKDKKKENEQKKNEADNQGNKDSGNGDEDGSGNNGDDERGGKDNDGTAAGLNDSDGGSGTSADDGTNGGAQAGAKSGASRTPRAFANAQSEVNQSKAETTPTTAASKKYYVYQGMNNNEVENAEDLDYDNPLAPYVLPAALVVFFIGALQAAWWYVRQQRETKMPFAPRTGAQTSSG